MRSNYISKVSFVLVLLLLIYPLSSFAVQHCFDYTIGPEKYNISIDECDESVGASFADNNIVFEGEGYAKYEFYLPFDSDYIEITCSPVEDISLKVLINDEVQVSHAADSSESSVVIYFPEVIRKGNCSLELQSGGTITVSDITFHKIHEAVSYSGPEEFTAEQRPVVSFTEYEEAIRTAVIINKGSPIIKVNGASRYIDYNNYKDTPYSENGITYLPIQSFGEAFGYYFEENYNEGSFILRTENVEFVFTGGKLYRQINHGEYKEIANNTLMKDGITYIPVRYYAELTGKTVLEKGDYIVADWRDLAEAIVSDEIFPLVQAEFEEFILADEEGITYYVAQTDSASDTNSGTFDEPFATLNKACEVAKAGDKVIIGEGVYREILMPQNNGTANNPIVFQAAEGADITISALEDIGSPDYEENDLWVYDVEWDLGDGRNQLFYKNEALAEGRHPNSHTSSRYYPKQLELCSLWPTQGNIHVTLDGNADIATSTTDLSQTDNYWAGGTLVSLHGNGYGVATAKITSSENGKLYLGEKSTRLWHKEGGSDAEDHIDFAYITDSLNTVDVPGEWFWGDGKLYIYPPEDETFETLKLEAKKRQITVDFSESKYVQLVDINTVGGGMKLNNSEMCVINGGTHEYISHYTYTDDTESAFIDTRDSIYDVYDADAAMYRGEVGIYLGGKNNAVINTNIRYSAAGGICLSGAYSYISNNLITECGYMGSGINGIYFFDSPLEDISIVKGGHALYNNTIDKTGRASLNLSSWTYPLDQERGLVPWVACDIAYNDFMNSNICTRDNGAVYAYGSVLGDERRKLQFHHNVIGNSWVSDGYAAGIYWDNWSQMVECYNNIVFYTDEKSSIDKYLHIRSSVTSPTAFSYVNAWNNSNADHLLFGKDGLTINDYPLNKWFASGCNASQESRFNRVNVVDNSMYKSTNAIALGDKITDGLDGAVHLNEEGQEICFEDVNFGESCQRLKLIYCGDRYNTGDTVLVSVGEENYKEVTLTCTGAKSDSLDEQIIYLENCSGTANVYVKCKDYKSAGIIGIYVCDDESSVNDTYSLKMSDDEDYYYLSGQFHEDSFGTEEVSVIGTITDFENDLLQSQDIYTVSENETFELSLKKPDYNGVYRFNIFIWENMSSIKPLNDATGYVYAENKYTNAFEKIKFRYADSYPQILSDNTAVVSYGKNDYVLFKNMDFRGSDAKALKVKYGLNDEDEGKLTVKIYLDSVNTTPILTFSPSGTGYRWSRQEFVYNLDTDDLSDGCHDVYFVIEGKSSLPIHLERFSFEE